jgi:hypothetical protein
MKKIEYKVYRETREKYKLPVQTTCKKCDKKFKDSDLIYVFIEDNNTLVCVGHINNL